MSQTLTVAVIGADPQNQERDNSDQKSAKIITVIEMFKTNLVLQKPCLILTPPSVIVYF